MTRTAVAGAFGDDWGPFMLSLMVARMLPRRWGRLVVIGAAGLMIYRWWRGRQGGSEIG